MKKFRFLFTVVLSLLLHTALSAQNISPQFSELMGMEDAQGNTHLLYRIRSYESSFNYVSAKNDIYNLVPGTALDTIIFHDGYTCGPYMGWGTIILDYDYWNSDLSKFIVSGDFVTCFEPAPFISRFDSSNVYSDWTNYTYDLFISKQNDSLVFGLPNLISYDGGFTWDTLELDHELVSVAPFNDAVYFAFEYEAPYRHSIYKSIDNGITFTLVDTGDIGWDPKFYYDIDDNHIYRTQTLDYPTKILKISPSQGNAFTWEKVFASSFDLHVCIDESQSGAIYLADGKRIIRSIDYGNTFILYKELDKRIIGIYKKPSSNKLYAASKYRIYEITDDTITVIKSLPIPDELLAYYPLAVGNKWIYYYLFVHWNSIGYQDIFVREAQSSEVKPNGKEYFKISEKYVQMGFESIVYERIDSIEGKVYRYNESCPNSEEFIEDLVMDVGDSTYAARFAYCYQHPPTELLSEQHFNNWNNWGIEGNRRNYRYVELVTADYFLSTNIGLDYFRLDDDNGWKEFALKGMLKNGIVYGDTTLTDVADENELPKEFSLSQNYPNPFNPVTTIKYTIPNVISTEGRNLKASLKVYDILGKEVATLVNEYKPAGSYEVNFSAIGKAFNISSGVYFYQLKAGDYFETKKMLLIK